MLALPSQQCSNHSHLYHLGIRFKSPVGSSNRNEEQRWITIKYDDWITLCLVKVTLRAL
jgi:hypothetical protein